MDLDPHWCGRRPSGPRLQGANPSRFAQGQDVLSAAAVSPPKPPLFRAVSSEVEHVHHLGNLIKVFLRACISRTGLAHLLVTTKDTDLAAPISRIAGHVLALLFGASICKGAGHGRATHAEGGSREGRNSGELEHGFSSERLWCCHRSIVVSEFQCWMSDQ